MFNVDRLRVAGAGLVCLLITPFASAEPGSRGHVSLEYQFVEQKSFYLSDGDTKVDLGKITAHTVQLDVAYNLNERWTVSVGVPWVMKKYDGPLDIHNHQLLDFPRDRKNRDDGSYYRKFGNYEIGAFRHFQYRDYSITPLVLLEIPSNPYTYFALSAPGDGLKKMSLGLQVSAPIGLSNFYTRGEYMYTFVEEAPGSVNVDHHRFQGELGYFVNPRWSLRAFALGRVGNGLDFPEDYPNFTDEVWYEHDKTMSHEFVNLGLGLTCQLNSKYSVSTWTQRMVWGRNSNTNDTALYVQVGFSF